MIVKLSAVVGIYISNSGG